MKAIARMATVMHASQVGFAPFGACVDTVALAGVTSRVTLFLLLNRFLKLRELALDLALLPLGTELEALFGFLVGFLEIGTKLADELTRAEQVSVLRITALMTLGKTTSATVTFAMLNATVKIRALDQRFEL
jgi:hypothetical protein